MAWTVTQQGTDYENANSTNLVIPSFTPSAGSLLVLIVGITLSGEPTAVSGHDGGVSWAKVIELTDSWFNVGGGPDGSGDGTVQVWACIVGSSPSAGTITVTKSGYSGQCCGAVLEITGDHDTSPSSMSDIFGSPDSYTIYRDSGETYSLTLASFASSNNMTLAIGGMAGTNKVTFESSPNSYTAFPEFGANRAMRLAWYDGADTNPTMTPANYSQTGFIAFEIKEDSGGGSTVLPINRSLNGTFFGPFAGAL